MPIGLVDIEGRKLKVESRVCRVIDNACRHEHHGTTRMTISNSLFLLLVLGKRRYQRGRALRSTAIQSR